MHHLQSSNVGISSFWEATVLVAFLWRRRPATTKIHIMKMMHGFSRGTRSEILFSGWSGAGTAMYALALLFVFGLCILVEWLSSRRLLLPTKTGVTTGILRLVLNALRVGLANLAMLAVMSFDGGIFLAAVAGHMVGFLAFASGAFENPEEAAHPHVGEGHRRSASYELLICGGKEVGDEILDVNMMT